MGITITAIKYVQSLRIKKFRQKYHHFVVEGDKSVQELLASDWKVVSWYHTKDFSPHPFPVNGVLVSDKEMERLSHHQAPQHALAVVEMPVWTKNIPSKGIQLYLDGIRDPGNLGTILRIADWYGLEEVWCSPDTVDAFNPKTIDASMGSFLRVKLHSDDVSFFSTCKLPVYAAVMDGENVHHSKLPDHAVLIVGNEGKGIQSELLDKVQNKISIPRYGKAESLNAGVATAVLLDNFFRGH
ncbi:MAG TPA: RNA methyltransferase [Bacteroidetes bacterium]|nr:RNA methyltransferase [Bacteroidota bacterium]